MDKQNEKCMVDLLNQEMKELQASQKQLEEMAKIILEASCKGSECANCEFVKRVEEAKITCLCLKSLYNAGYRKIPENAVVVSKQIWDEHIENREEGMKIFEKRVRKETAEKFVERLKELEEALLDMVVQFCQMGEEGKLKHAFMSAEEQAFDVLDIKYGEKVDKVYKRFQKKWSKPIDEIAKELTGDKVKL